MTMGTPNSFSELLHLLPTGQVQSAARLGLQLGPNVDQEAWSKLISRVVQRAGKTAGHRDTLTAWLGDLLAYGADRYVGQIKEYAEAAGLSPGTLRDAKMVCGRIPLSCRRDTLSWSHHCEVGKAFKELSEIEEWLAIAEKGGHPKSELRRMIRAHVAGGDRDSRREEVFVASTDVLTLLREARGLGRLVRAQERTWSAWSAGTCQRALEDLEPIGDFIAALREKADAWERDPQSKSDQGTSLLCVS